MQIYKIYIDEAIFLVFFFESIFFYLHLHSQTRGHRPDGGIGRRARLKLVFLGVWVRFPLRAQKA